jgi:O-antigen/teichoic acid export membrane protein
LTDSTQLFHSYLWQLLSKWAARSLGIISTLILVRILTPEDFGLAAQSMMVIMFFQSLSQTGTNQFIIKMKTVSNSQLMSAWTLNLLVRTFTALIVFVFAASIAEFIGDARLSSVLQVACLVPIIGNFLSPGTILLQKNMKFKKLSIMDITSKCISFIVTISLAYMLQNYWALILGNVAAVVTSVLVSYFIAPIVPKPNIIYIKEQWLFTKGIFLSSVLGYLRSKADIFIISKKFGSSSVGHYSIAQEFSLLPLTEVISPIMMPLYSSLAKVMNNKVMLEDKISKYISLAYILLFPSIVGIMFLSTDIVLVVLGDEWLEAAPVLANLSLLMVVFFTNNTFKQVFILKEAFKGVIIIDLIGLMLIAGAFIWPLIDTMESFSVYRAGIGGVVILATLLMIKFTLKFSLSTFLLTMVVPSIGALVMWFVLHYSSSAMSEINNIPLSVLLNMLIGAVSYSITSFACLYCLKGKHNIWHFNYSFIVSALKRIIKKT